MVAEIEKYDTSLWQQQMLNRDSKLEQTRKEVLTYTIDFLNSIKESVAVEEIYLFGSILRERMFNEDSDIDIAIKGLKDDKLFFRIWTQLDAIPSRNVDLLDFESCNFGELIIKYGLKIK